ncbi:hypothetical protein CAEBREN_16824 [Caenorhabditis brenneri]|uniref:F-box domain-containing protein n=1 Tax=Caenorhabditis brenneri TaxID=135651 RepID=G0N831_CAEBE|nr:hypothetical protein CAEBREN_16824 [Caenorhabditis brenneri]
MAARRFPLLHLPLLCIDCVLQQFEIVDTIDFSMISKKCYRIVNFLPRPFKAVNIEMRHDWLHILFKNESAVCGRISFDKRGLAFLFKQDKSFDEKNGIVPSVAYKCINGLDILRSDGLLATVEMKNGHFLFFVFHERFSDVTKATIHDL